LLLHFGLLQLKAQSFDEKNFSLYSVKDGLSNNQVSSVTQDAYGYIWIGTNKGLNRFDGNSFLQLYSLSKGNGLPEDGVYRLKWVNKEDLCAITLSGVHIINSRTLQERNIYIHADSLKNQSAVNSTQDVAADKKGNIFILSGTGFYEFNNEDKLVFRYDHYSSKYAQTGWVNFGRNLIKMQDNTLLLSTIGGLYIYNIEQKKLHPLNTHDDLFYQQIAKPKERFWFMHGDNNSFSVQPEEAENLFLYDVSHKTRYLITAPFATIDKFDWRSKIFRLNDTLFAINGAEKGFYLIHYNQNGGAYDLLPEIYFENYFCSSLFIDKTNRLWIGTNKGLFREKRSTETIEKFTVPQQWNPFNSDLAIGAINVSNNRVFAATSTEGILVIDRNEQRVIKRIDFLKYWKRANEVFCMVSPDKDTIIAGTYGALVWINTINLKQGKIDLPAWDSSKYAAMTLLQDAHNNIYAGINRSDRFYYRDAKDNKFILSDQSQNDFFKIQVPMTISEDPEGNIWFAAAGICRYNYNLHRFDKLIDSITVLAMAFDKSGKMYCGTRQNGLFVYDLLHKTFERFTRSEGLPDNTITALYVHNNKLWIGTESGLASYDPGTKKIAAFGVADEMPVDPFTAAAFYYDSVHQQLYGAFNNTIVRFDPDKLIKNNSPPDFFIDNIFISGDKTIYHPADKIELSYKHNDFIINLASINFEDAYRQQFAYRFANNKNEPWQETGSQRGIIFSNLSPGNHRLQLKVFIKNNSWPEQVKEINIIVHPPFWQTGWFIFLAIILLLTSLFSLYKYRISIIKQKSNIDKQLAELEMKGLHAQMNPHFIFNSLNSIKEMILEDEKQNASRYLSKFAQLIRTNLEQSKQTFITVKQCIDHLEQYLEMEKIRFDKFNYTVDVDEGLPSDEIRMSPMLIQPLVENAIWHGLQNQTGEKNLMIRFYKKDEQLVCEIEDNGIGINESKKKKIGLRPVHRSLGISNIHDRLVVLNEKYKMNCSLQITDKSELPGNKTGTLVTLRFNV
jgi:ligand-binding sensor domain-containing protein/two-component sensor histidine kinase